MVIYYIFFFVIIYRYPFSFSTSDLYPFRSYLDMYLNYGYSAKLGYLEAFSYFEDTEELMDSKENNGFKSRRQLFLKEGTTTNEFSDTPIAMMSKIFSNLTSTTYPILSNVTARIELTFQNPSFYMQDFGADSADKKFRIKCSAADLLIPTRTLNLGLYADLELRLNQKPLLYPVKRVQLNKFNFPKGNQTHIINALNTSSINPDRICFFFLPEKTFEGDYSKSPFAFRTTFGKASLTRLNLTIDGIAVEQDSPTGNQSVKMAHYYQLHSHLGCLFSQNQGPAISYTKFFSDGFVAMYDLTKSNRAWASTGGRQTVKSGHLKLEIAFSTNLTEPLLVFAMSEYHSSFSINKNRTVVFNFVA